MEAKNLIGGMLVGTAIGVAVGVLFAPTSGKQARKKIVGRSNDVISDLKKTLQSTLDSLRSEYNNGVDHTTKRSKEVISKIGQQAKV